MRETAASKATVPTSVHGSSGLTPKSALFSSRLGDDGHSQAQPNTHGEQPARARQDQPQDASGVRAQSHPHSDLAPARRHHNGD